MTRYQVPILLGQLILGEKSLKLDSPIGLTES